MEMNSLTVWYSTWLSFISISVGGIRAADAEDHELLDGVVLDVVVVHLHQLDIAVVAERRLAEGLGRVDLHLCVLLLVPQPAQPDALARRAAVLLDHARLEGAALLEARV